MHIRCGFCRERSDIQPCAVDRDHIVLIDAQGIVLWISHVLPGVRLSEVIGRPLWQSFVPLDVPRVRDTVLEVLHRGQDRSVLAQDHFLSRWWQLHCHPVLHATCGDMRAMVYGHTVCPGAARLSLRQRQILLLLVAGHSLAHIAQRLMVGVNTVRTHVLRARRILRIANLDEMLLWARINYRTLLLDEQLALLRDR
jgi:DNA-binding CsgD family transcriptional regulator